MNEATWIDVDLRALAANLAVVRSHVSPADVMVVVKKDAYGHGITPVVNAALSEGFTRFGVLDCAVGIAVRNGGIPQSTQLFAWLLGPDEDYAAAIDARVDLGVSTLEQLAAIAEAGAARRASIHLKIDTGLSRAGARPEDWPSLVQEALRLEVDGVLEIVGVWTHISEASEQDDTAAIAAFRTANDVLGDRPTLIRHLAASAASFERSDSRFDVVRVGAFAYGIAPGGGIGPAQLGLEPVMALRSRVVETTADGWAILGIGRIDGLPSVAGASIFAEWRGEQVKIENIDLTTTTIVAPAAAPGDVVTLFGAPSRNEPTLQEWADALGTIGEELVVQLSHRIPRRYS